MKRILVGAALAGVLLACGLDVGPLGAPRLILTPVLDTLFVGDLLVKRQVTFIDEHGNEQDPGVVQWSSRDTTLFTVDGATGKITGHGPGIGVLLADAHSAEGFAVIVVAPSLKVTLLVDTMFLMPGDTFTIPVSVKHEAPGTPVVWFSTTPNAALSLDTASGLVTANAVGGTIQVTAHAALTPDTAADGGAIQVVQPSDTAGGFAYYTIFGTAQRARRVSVRGSIHHRQGGQPTFQLHLPTIQNGSTQESVDLVVLTPPAAPGVFPIDSISLTEAGSATVDPFCRPPRDWGRWFSIVASNRLDAVSRSGGSLTVSQIVAVPHGLIMSGHFYLPAQRIDRYDDPSAALPIHGSFVTPVITEAGSCP